MWLSNQLLGRRTLCSLSLRNIKTSAPHRRGRALEGPETAEPEPAALSRLQLRHPPAAACRCDVRGREWVLSRHSILQLHRIAPAEVEDEAGLVQTAVANLLVPAS